MKNLINFIIFQSLWLLSVISAAKGSAYVGVLAISIAAASYLWRSQNRLATLKFYSFAISLGFVVDTLLIQLNTITIRPIEMSISPLFMVALWINFILTFNYSLHWIHRSLILGIVLAMLGAPLAYITGEKLAAIYVNSPLLYSLPVIGGVWGISMALLMISYRHWQPK